MSQSQSIRSLVVALLMSLCLGSSLSAVAQQPKAPAKDVPPAPKYKVGDTAPDFTLKDQNGKDVSLHDFRGKKSVALAFFVFAFTGG
jgi:cytochrome oxidase Cu insertion factor (SCO1/SenC/PrrC family)